MRVNTSTSVVLPLSSKPSNKSSSEAENYPLASYSTQVQVGEPFSADPRFAEMVQYGTQALAEAMTGLKGEKAQEAFAKKMELFGPETREHRPSAAELEKQLQMQADCRIPSDHIPIRSWPLFLARELMRDLIETLKAEQST